MGIGGKGFLCWLGLHKWVVVKDKPFCDVIDYTLGRLGYNRYSETKNKIPYRSVFQYVLDHTVFRSIWNENKVYVCVDCRKKWNHVYVLEARIEAAAKEYELAVKIFEESGDVSKRSD
jgi:hypothetical protein